MSTTTHYGWTKPTINGSADTWGTSLNADLDGIDTTVFTISGVASGAATAAAACLVAANNGSDIVSTSTFRNNLGVAIGSNVQAYSDLLTTLAGLGTSQKIVFFSGTNTPAELTVSTGLTLSGTNLTSNVQTVAGRTGAVVLSNTDISGLGSLATSSNSSALNAGTNALGAVTVSTSTPSGTPGTNDEWIQYVP